MSARMVSSYSVHRRPKALVPTCPQQVGFWKRAGHQYSHQFWLLFPNTRHSLAFSAAIYSLRIIVSTPLNAMLNLRLLLLCTWWRYTLLQDIQT